MLISVLAFTVMNACAKYLENVSAFQIVFFRSLGSLVLSIAFLQVKSISIWGTHHGLLISRGIIGTTSMALFFLTVKEIPFGSAVSLRYLSPIFAGIFAVIWLRERITALQWICFVTAFIGVLILKGFDPRISTLGLTYILSSALLSGIVYVIVRQIGTREHPAVVVAYYMFFASLIGGILSCFYWVEPAPSDWWVFAGLGLFGFFGQYFMTKAYQIASVGTVAPMKYIESVFALGFGWIWFNEGYDIWSLLGIFLIVGSMLLNIFVKRK